MTIGFCLIALFTNCNSNDNALYIFMNSQEFQIKTLKFIKQNSNQLSSKNIINQYNNKFRTVNGFYYGYNIPCGKHEVYIEYLKNDTFFNERKEIVINCGKSKNQWVILKITNDKADPLKTEYGTGICNFLHNSD